MVVLVDLDRRQLALVNNVLVAQRAQIEPIMKADGVGGTLAQDVELAFELLLVEYFGIGSLWGVPSTIS